MKKAYRTKKASKKSKKANQTLIKEQNLFYVRELEEFPDPKNKKNLKIFSWNVNGFRAISGKIFMNG